MKAIVVLLIGLAALCGRSSGQKYFQEVHLLSGTERSVNAVLDDAQTELIFTVSDETRSQYGRARYSIFVYIDEMHCTLDITDPHYPRFSVESGELNVTIPTRENSFCQDVNDKTEPFIFPLNDGTVLGADRIRVTPWGKLWGTDKYNATLRAELRITRQILLGDETPVMDLNLDHSIDYEFDFVKDSKFCKENGGYKCAITVVPTRVRVVNEGSEVGREERYLSYNFTDKNGDAGSGRWETYIETTNGPSIIQSFGKISLESGTGIKALLTASLQLYHDDSHECPKDYSVCSYSDSFSNCIPDEWKCDGRQNCPGSFYDSDEKDDVCRAEESWNDYYGYCYGYSSWSFTWFVVVAFLLLCGVLFIISAIRAICLHKRRPARNPRRNSPSFPEPVKDVPPTYFQATGNAASSNA